jgi:hypothetical protein
MVEPAIRVNPGHSLLFFYLFEKKGERKKKTLKLELLRKKGKETPMAVARLRC